MEQEQDLRDMPQHIVNGFSFNESSAKLMAYALDMTRVGANIDQEFWDTRIVDNGHKPDMVSIITTSGPLLARHKFDMFESLERCRSNAPIVFDAVLHGYTLLMKELAAEFLSDSDTIRIDLSGFSHELRQYLLRPAEEKDLRQLETYRVQSAVMYDSTPVLLSLSGNKTQYVWNGEWAAMRLAPMSDRTHFFNMWKFNHAFTLHRLRQLTTAYLYNKFPEQFGGKSA